MKFWILPIVLGVCLGVAYLMFFPHATGLSGQRVAHVLTRGGPAAASPSPGISEGMKMAGIAIGIVLAFIPVDAVKQIGTTLAAAATTALFV